MKIAFMSAMVGYSWGGSEELWSLTAARLAGQGTGVAVCMRRPRQLHPKLAAIQHAGVTFEFVRPRRKIERMLRGTDTSLQAALAAAAPDVALISLGALFDGMDPMRAARAAGVPYALIVHAVIDTWRPDWWLQFRELYREAVCVYFVSEDNRRAATRLLMVHPREWKVVRNPFQVPYDAPLPWPADAGDAVRLAMVARMDFPAKGHDILFETLALPKWRERPLEVGLFGAGPHDDYFREMAGFWQLENVRFHGHVNDVIGIWREHHALILPSRYEGTPITVVEAMLCGRPVIVTDIAGNSEMAEDEVSGFVAAAPTVRHLDEALERAWTRRADWRQMGIAAAARARSVLPSDPVGAFAEELVALASNAGRHRSTGRS